MGFKRKGAAHHEQRSAITDGERWAGIEPGAVASVREVPSSVGQSGGDA